ncbi:MAG: SEC-C domain-containing protein [Actinomycetota bacterium]|nr:MAG: SEC-C domain-containing protein [Actinomycetota bacterium]
MNPSEYLLGLVLDILEHEPKPLIEIVHSLAERGIISNLDSPSDDLSRILEESDDIWSAATGLYNRTDKMLNGLCLTHRITRSEIEHDLIHVFPDLDGLDFNLDTIYMSATEQLKIVYRDLDGIDHASEHGSYIGPPGWLSEFSSGDLIAFRRIADTYIIFRPEALGPGQVEQQALLNAFNNLYTDARGVEPMEMLLDALCEDPSLFREPVPPIQELCYNLLLEPRGIWLGPIIEEWDTPGGVWYTEKKNKLAEDLGFAQCCTKEFEFALAAWKTWRDSKQANLDYKAVLNALSHDMVATGFTSWVFQYESSPYRSVETFMTDLVSSGGSKAAAGYYVRAISRALEGKAILAEKDLQMALRHDPKFEMAKIELASFFADRGDIQAYISALRQCDPARVLGQIKEAEALLPPYAPTDRNQPCPCGSRLKYKACCLKSPKLSTTTRINWLIQRVTRWMARPERQENLSDYFLTFNEMLGEPIEDDYDNFILDVAIFEGGGIDEYMGLRGELLSPVDRHILETMKNSKRELFEVVEINRGQSLTLRDTLTGEYLTVNDQLASLDCKIGDYILSRAINSLQGRLLIGQTLRINLRQRDDLLNLLRHQPEPFDFLGWFASTLKPLRILNFDGEEIIFTKAVLKPDNADGVAAALTEKLGEMTNGQWVVSRPWPDSDSISIATLTIENEMLIVETNSPERLEQTLQRLEELIGRFEVIENTQQTISSIAENFTGHVGIDSDQDLEEEIRNVIESHIEMMEDRWLDESIPALGGLSPRQAMNDPTRKEDLIRLLNEFERNETRLKSTKNKQTAGFKTARIRKKLGFE